MPSFGDPTDPAAMLALLEGERTRAARALEPDPRIVYGVWGAAWLVGFLAWWSGQGRGPIDLSYDVGGAIFTGCMLGAGITTGVHSTRRVAGVRGASSRLSARLGWAWGLAFLALAAIMNGLLIREVGPELIGLLWSVLSGLVVGTVYATSGAIWQDRVQFRLGAWILVISGAGGLAGYPYVYLVMAIAGGGGFLAAALWFALRPSTRPARGGCT